MIISCPYCTLTREIGDVTIPSDGTSATCPRCGCSFDVRPERKVSWFKRRRAGIGITALILCLVSVIMMHDWKLDKDYFLEPSKWQGEMTYLGKKHPFELVIEKARDGRIEGYMDWVETTPRYRLAIRGTYVGNHVVFEDYAFLERQGTTGLNDKQDVYIVDNKMIGTAKNGNAKFHAEKR